MKIPAYPRYKSSGVEWLGDVPEHWATQGVKFCYTIQLGKMLQPEPASPADEETPYLKSQHVQWEHVRVTDLPTMWTNKKERRQYSVKDGDLLVCEGGDVGRAAVVRGSPDGTIIQNALHRVRPQGKNETGFLLYVLAHAASQGWFEIICNRSTIAHFTVEKFGALGVALPTPAEQRAIAAFLDQETGRVDRLVAKKRELIERLKEKRTALISRTVTQGLLPEAATQAGLPANPHLKPSGFDWLKQIPEHWDVLPFTKYVADKSDYRGKTPDKQPNGVFLVTARNVRMGYIDYDSSQEFIAEEDYDEVMRRGLPKKGDLLFTTEAPLGNVALVDREDIALAQRIIRFRMSPARYLSTFVLFAMMSEHFQVQLRSLSTGSTAEGLKASKLPILRLIAPPLPEQAAIAAYLDAETTILDALVAKVEAAVERLQEYRTALITAAVTGRIDVRQKKRALPQMPC